MERKSCCASPRRERRRKSWCALNRSEKWGELRRAAEASGVERSCIFTTKSQERNSDAWAALEDYIERSRGGRERRVQSQRGIGSKLWQQIVTLPASIAKLQSVKYFALYGSPLVRIPPEIGELKKPRGIRSLQRHTVCTGFLMKSPAARS